MKRLTLTLFFLSFGAGLAFAQSDPLAKCGEQATQLAKIETSPALELAANLRLLPKELSDPDGLLHSRALLWSVKEVWQYENVEGFGNLVHQSLRGIVLASKTSDGLKLWKRKTGLSEDEISQLSGQLDILNESPDALQAFKRTVILHRKALRRAARVHTARELLRAPALREAPSGAYGLLAISGLMGAAYVNPALEAISMWLAVPGMFVGPFAPVMAIRAVKRVAGAVTLVDAKIRRHHLWSSPKELEKKHALEVEARQLQLARARLTPQLPKPIQGYVPYESKAIAAVAIAEIDGNTVHGYGQTIAQEAFALAGEAVQRLSELRSPNHWNGLLEGLKKASHKKMSQADSARILLPLVSEQLAWLDRRIGDFAKLKADADERKGLFAQTLNNLSDHRGPGAEAARQRHDALLPHQQAFDALTRSIASTGQSLQAIWESLQALGVATYSEQSSGELKKRIQEARDLIRGLTIR